MKPISTLLLPCATVALLAVPVAISHGATITPGFQDRIVTAEAGASDLNFDPFFATDGAFTTRRLGGTNYGLFDETQTATASFGSSSANASTRQRSAVETQSIFAEGQLAGSATTTAQPGWGGGSASTRNVFELYFSVDAQAMYNLTTDLGFDVAGEVAYNIDAARILFERDGGLEVFLERQLATDPGGSQVMQVALEPGSTYYLLAEFPLGGTLSPDNNGGATFNYTGQYLVRLTPVPEPAAVVALLTLAGTGALVWLRRRRKQAGARQERLGVGD